MRCLVTGASGHVGSFLTQLLVERGHEVSILTRFQSNLWRLGSLAECVRVIRMDTVDADVWRREVMAAAPDTVFHLAWEGVVAGQRDDPAQISRNVANSLSLLETLLKTGCSTWIGMGSQAEYGPCAAILTETTPTSPASAYGVAKLACGNLCRAMCDLAGIRFVWVRLLAAYGPKDDPRRLIPGLIRKLLRRERPALTPGEQRWDYLYITDAAEALYALAQAPAAAGIFNLGSGQAQTVRSIAECIRDIIDPHLPLGLGDLPYPPGQTMLLLAGIERLSSATSWKPRIGMRQGLWDTVRWYQETPQDIPGVRI